MSDKNDAGLAPNEQLFPTGRSKPKKGYAWLVWALAAISFGYAFFHRVAPSVMVSDLMAEFAIGGAMLGTSVQPTRKTQKRINNRCKRGGVKIFIETGFLTSANFCHGNLSYKQIDNKGH